ncbi:hypothetical protein D3C86_1231230 [compost metagenome]
MGNAGAFADGVLGARRVPQVTLEVGDFRIRHHILFHIFRTEIDAGTEIGVHRSLAVFGHEDHGAGGRREGAFRFRFEIDTLGADIVLEDFSELVFRHLAEIGGLTAEIRHACRRVASAAAGGFKSRPHKRIKQFGAFRVDEVHRTFGNGIVVEKAIIAAGDNVDDGIADSQYVEFRHRPYPFRTGCAYFSKGLKHFSRQEKPKEKICGSRDGAKTRHLPVMWLSYSFYQSKRCVNAYRNGRHDGLLAQPLSPPRMYWRYITDIKGGGDPAFSFWRTPDHGTTWPLRAFPPKRLTTFFPFTAYLIGRKRGAKAYS